MKSPRSSPKIPRWSPVLDFTRVELGVKRVMGLFGLSETKHVSALREREAEFGGPPWNRG